MLKIHINGVSKAKDVVKQKGNCSFGLLASMNDPNLAVDQDSLTVTIKDKYPKAKHHFLIMPKENIPGLMSLKKENLKLLKHMKSVADKLCSKFDENFKIGYHSVPSMQRLHLHVISDDFVSPCLKTKVHWNSFTTTFFMTSDGIFLIDVV